MKINRNPRIRRSTKIRATIVKSGLPRVCVHKSSKHIYAQIINAKGDKTLAASSSLDKSIKGSLKSTCSIKAAKLVATDLAKKAKKLNLKKVAFDRSGFKYHGKILALAETLRAEGLNF